MRTLRKARPLYDEFEVVITPRDLTGVFQARAQSTVGTAAEEFRLPVAIEDWPGIRQELSEVMVSAAPNGPAAVVRGSVALDDEENEAPSLSPRTFGVSLFNALFRGEVGMLFERARASAQENKRAGLRLRLTFSFSNETAEWFTSVVNLPWELMAPSEAQHPIVINAQSPLVRSFDRVLHSLDVIEPPIRLLVLSASPQGTDRLSVDTEVERMRAHWSRAPAVLFRAQTARVAEVEKTMAEFQPHIVHFIGHGTVLHGRGVLLFERDDGTAQQVDANELATLLARNSTRLVYLNSCRGAEVGSDAGSSPFAGVATSLAKQQVPAIIAMQFPVTDTTAIAFCDSFYEQLVKGYPIDAAVGVARRRVFARGTREWATPVLFLREPDAQLIRKPSAAQLAGLAPFEARGLVEVLSPEPTAAEAASADDTTPPTPVDDDEELFVAFLASAPRSVDHWVARAQAEMLRMGWTVVRVNDPAWPDYGPLFQQLTRCCHLFVHIVGPRPGDEIVNVPPTEAPYHPVQQFHLAFASASSQLVIFPQGTPRRSTDPHLSAMLECIEVSRRESSQFESIECDIERLHEHLHAHYALMQRTELEAAGAIAPPEEALFVDVHERDVAAAAPLFDILDQHNVPYLLTTATRARLAALSTGEPVTAQWVGAEAPDALGEFQTLVRRVPLMIVTVGSAGGDWLMGRLREGMKAAVQRETPTQLVVLRLPGNTDAPAVPSFARVFSSVDGISEQSLRDLLALRNALSNTSGNA
jgi:hypothetical protein